MTSRQHSRRLARQMTLSGDSSTSYPASSSHRSLSRVFGRALSTTLTLNSAEGSCSTILLEDWKPIFDKFDREIDGKQVTLYFEPPKPSYHIKGGFLLTETFTGWKNSSWKIHRDS